MKIKIILFLFSIISLELNAQAGKECLNDIFKLEEKIYSKSYNDGDKPAYISYNVLTTDWEDQTNSSNVKVYKDKNNMHFFSEQVNIFQDEKDVFLILKMQKLVIVNSTKKEITNKKINDNFLELRKEFLENCTVVKCEKSPQNEFIKTLELKVNDNMGGVIKIEKMIYTYNTQTEKILTTKIDYNEEYKVKEIFIKYNELEMESNYSFISAKKNVLDRNNKLLPKYKGYELVDNRKE